MRTLREKDNANIRKTGIRRYFTIETFEEASRFLSKWYRAGKYKRLYTGDFSTMYTRIPHNDLISAVQSACSEAFEWQSEQSRTPLSETRLCWSKSRATWKASKRPGSCHTNKEHSFDTNAIVDLVSFLVANTFLVNGDAIKRQKVGIPMGTNCAPVLANLFLYVYESRYVDRLTAMSANKARQFHLTFRFIDDVLSLDNAHWPAAIEQSSANGGLYPAELELSDTSISEHEAHFLGLHIVTQANRLRIAVYDKRNSFPFEVKRYPRMDSLIPGTIPYGVLSGQLHRGYRICSDHTDFLAFSVQVAQRLHANGCKPQRLIKKFRAFARKNIRKYSVKSSTLCKLFASNLGN